MVIDPCSCSCWMPAGWYSSGGWHLRRITQEEADADWMLKNYVGTPVAVEPCPAYQAVAQKSFAAERAKQAAETSGRVGRLRA